jgi:outer membrane protein OmpA-like peptidoglycan-associated protein
MEYQMESIFKSYINGKLTINSPNTNVRKDIDVVIPMKKINYKLEVKVSDKKTGNALESCNLMIYDKLKGNLVYISDVTGLSGMITKRLEGKNFGDKVSLKIESEKNTYLKTTTDFDVELANDSVIKIAIILDKLALGVDVGKVVNINPIYFDLDKSNIRPDAAIELDKIVKAMQDNPSIVIELGSHTDCRAAASYNMALSDKRAKSSASYIVSKGIKKDRIYGKGYGESRLVNNCGCEGSKQSDCTEEEHQKNRRTEFKIVKITN